MNPRTVTALFALAVAAVACRSEDDATPQTKPIPDDPNATSGGPPVHAVPAELAGAGGTGAEAVHAAAASVPKTRTPPPPPAPFVVKGVDWLVAAQHEEGGWGGGSHSRQDVRDPHAVKMDPGTTAFAAMALVRSGHSIDRGEHAEAVRKATDYLLAVVEAAEDKGPYITDVRGTQPQAKMGQQVDTALASQFFSRLLPDVEGTELEPRVTAAIDKCLEKIQKSQDKSGAWGQGGWAPVLQTSLMTNALETGVALDRDVDVEVLDQARAYQRGLVVEGGKVRADAAAGVPLYAAASNIRANANVAKQAQELVASGKADGTLPEDAEVSSETLEKLGVAGSDARVLADSFDQNRIAKSRMFDEALLSGFGNNGGEEFLSYMLKSESLVIDGGDEWQTWNSKMHDRLAKVQNENGSWSGHHCITSPVFCTAAAISCLTAERDAELLEAVAIADAK